MQETAVGAGVTMVPQPYDETVARQLIGFPCEVEIEGRVVRGTIVSVTAAEHGCDVGVVED